MKKYNKKIELKRVNMNLPASLVARVEEYAESMGLNTTNAYIVLLNNALDYKDTMNYLPALLEVCKQVGSNEETKDKQLDVLDSE